MYTRSLNRSHGNIYSQYHPFPIQNRFGYVKGSFHHRVHTEKWNDDIWRMERASLQQELNEEKQSNKRSMRIIEELLADNKKYQEQVFHSSSKIRGIKDKKKCLMLSQKNEKPFNEALKTQPILKIKQKCPPAPQSHNQKPSRKEESFLKAQQMNNTKNAIFRKLYEEKKVNQTKINAVKKETQQQHEEILLKQEIKFLKQQLLEKNQRILNLECELLKRQKQITILKERSIPYNQNMQESIDRKKKNSYYKMPSLSVKQFLENPEDSKLNSCSIPYESRFSICKLPYLKIRKFESFDKQIQAQTIEVIEKEVQTSDNFYEYIEETYLEWFFEKEYQKLKDKKKDTE